MSRTWHYYFHLIQQPLDSATWSSGLFLFHKDHVHAVLCKQPLTQELTISVSELQLCSLFPVSFSNSRRPLQPQAISATRLSSSSQRPKLEITELGIFSHEEQSSLVRFLPPDRQAQSIILSPPARAVPSVFRCARLYFYMKFIKHSSRFSPGSMYAVCCQHV